MKPPEDFDIRFSEMEDLEPLTRWLSVPGGCDPFPFSEEEKEEALKNWVGFSRFKASLTGLSSGAPCAVGTLFLMPYRKVAHHCSFYLVVAPEKRRQGIGRAMVRNLLHLAKRRFRLESVHVELFEPSLLQPLLENLGFSLFARQEKFVKMGEGRYEARLLMEHGLDGY